MTRSPVVRFVVLFPGRSGGTYLGTALASYPGCVFETEPLGIRRNLGVEGQLRWTRRFLRGRPLTRRTAIGLSTKVADLADPDGFAELLRRLDGRAILLRRNNEVKQVVSIVRARLLRDTVGRWNLRDAAGTPGPVHIDPADFERRLRDVRTRNLETVAYAETVGVPLLRLDYEDLLVRPDESLGRVLAFLGLEVRPLTPVTVKATSDDLRRAVENFDELRAAYAGTEWAGQFDEVLVEP